ncbi:MAG: T9SS type A sorting domain-containing protein [Bacteroidetes bacterium]|nr:T9SS type A sorting domain-containing protein [Bacteroidota bacterium]
MNIVFRIAALIVMTGGILSAQNVTTLIQGSSFNDGLALDAQGNIYASYYYNTVVTKITPQGNATAFATGLSSPNGLTFGPDGNLYIPNATGGTITRVTQAGVKSTFLTIADPATIMFNSDGSMLVTHYNLNKISHVDTAKNVTTFLSGSPLNGPIGLVRDTAGTLYIANFTDGKVFRYHRADSLQQIADIPGWLGFMAISRNTLFVTGYQQCRIYRIPLNGGPTTSIAGNGGLETVDGPFLSASFANPNGIAITPSGDTMYVSDYSTRALRQLTGFHTVTSVPRGRKSAASFRLEQNYPNPFNPSTTVSFSVPQQSHVRMDVYSILGERVAQLIDGTMSAGEHSALFDGSELASGMYLIRMTVGTATATVKAQLIK